ncbi:MAG TPA: DUF6036 family nucleotidyltransferase [Thermoanaerobaculia bacterium]
MNVSKDFEELFGFFNARKVKALIVGGYAFCFHARPRTTKDIDILLEPTVENAQNVLRALDDFGFGSLPVTIEDLTEPGRILQFGYPPGRIELLTSIKEVSFPEAWENRVAGRFGRAPVFYLGLEDLIRNKAAVGRLQDLADVEVLRRFARKKRSGEWVPKIPEAL